LQKKLFALAEAHLDDADREVRNPATALLVHFERLFPFLEEDGVKPTNNGAEPELLHGFLGHAGVGLNGAHLGAGDGAPGGILNRAEDGGAVFGGAQPNDERNCPHDSAPLSDGSMRR
jgi:hypothetical protein